MRASKREKERREGRNPFVDSYVWYSPCTNHSMALQIRSITTCRCCSCLSIIFCRSGSISSSLFDCSTVDSISCGSIICYCSSCSFRGTLFCGIASACCRTGRIRTVSVSCSTWIRCSVSRVSGRFCSISCSGSVIRCSIGGVGSACSRFSCTRRCISVSCSIGCGTISTSRSFASGCCRFLCTGSSTFACISSSSCSSVGFSGSAGRCSVVIGSTRRCLIGSSRCGRTVSNNRGCASFRYDKSCSIR